MQLHINQTYFIEVPIIHVHTNRTIYIAVGWLMRGFHIGTKSWTFSMFSFVVNRYVVYGKWNAQWKKKTRFFAEKLFFFDRKTWFFSSIVHFTCRSMSSRLSAFFWLWHEYSHFQWTCKGVRSNCLRFFELSEILVSKA